MQIATFIAAGLALYAGLGLIFAIALVCSGLGDIDPAARGAAWAFRILIVPGLAALWPWMLVRWKHARTGPRP